MLTIIRRIASGLLAQQYNVDVTAHNVANVSTPGFKRGRPEFQPGIDAGPPGEYAQLYTGAVPAAGVRNPTSSRVFTPGPLVQTGRPLDLAIEGEGFFQVELEDGTIAYTRSGAFAVDADGRLVTASGRAMAPGLVLPPESGEPQVAQDGTVTVLAPDGTATRVGTLVLARFPSPEGLEGLGDGLFRATPASGDPEVGQPGSGRLGIVHSGVLEGSNVELAQEFTSLLLAQRTYSFSLRALQTADEMLAEASRLRTSA